MGKTWILKEFMYKVVKEGGRAREYENALQWLVDAQLAPTAFGEGNRLFTEFKGALTENCSRTK